MNPFSAIKGFFGRPARLGIESEAPAKVLPRKPQTGRRSKGFGNDAYEFMGRALMSSVGRIVPNSDHLTAVDYRAMLNRDDSVKWVVKYASLCIMANWRPYMNENKRVRNYVEELFDRCETSILDWGEEALSSKWVGYSATETVLFYADGKLWAKELPVIDPNFDFIFAPAGSENAGKVSAIRQRGSLLDGTGDISADRLIIHTNNGLFGDPHGVSDLKCSFAKFVAKEHLFLQWGRTIERYGTPSAYATSSALESEELSWLDAGVTTTRADNILDMLSRLGEDAVGALPEDVKIQFLEAKNAVGQDFEKHQNYCTKAILRGFLVSQIMSEASDVGSFALGEKHYDVFLANCASDTMKLQRSLMRNLIAPLIRWNFGPNVPLGGFAKPELSKEERAALATEFFALTNAGYMDPGERVDSDFVREKMGQKPASDKQLAAAGERHNGKGQKDNSQRLGAGENLPAGQAPDGLRNTDPGVPNPTPQTPGEPQGRGGKKAA